MREIRYLVVHCTATPLSASVESILAYWRESCRWKHPGYHYLALPSGEVVALQSESLPANGVAGYNAQAIHIAYIGGVDPSGAPADNRTPEQKTALARLLEQLRRRYPGAVIQGHRDFPGVRKSCPSFDARAEYREL